MLRQCMRNAILHYRANEFELEKSGVRARVCPDLVANLPASEELDDGRPNRPKYCCDCANHQHKIQRGHILKPIFRSLSCHLIFSSATCRTHAITTEPAVLGDLQSRLFSLSPYLCLLPWSRDPKKNAMSFRPSTESTPHQ